MKDPRTEGQMAKTSSEYVLRISPKLGVILQRGGFGEKKVRGGRKKGRKGSAGRRSLGIIQLSAVTKRYIM